MVKLVVFWVGMFSLGIALGSDLQRFAPENDGWKYDCIDCESANMTREVFDKIADIGAETYKEEIAERGERLVVSKDWTNSEVNAYAQRRSPQGGMVQISMFGGLARRAEVDARGFAIVFCHEANHLYPLWANYWQGAEQLRMGSEGAADTGATTKCFNRIAEKIPEILIIDEQFEPFIEEKCGDNLVCKNSLAGGKQLANLLSALGRGPKLEFSDMATEQVDKTISYGYPRVQCRLTSYVWGTLQLGRPGCWFKD